MSEQEKPAEQRTETQSDSRTGTSDNAVKEAADGKEDLVKGIKKAIDMLKSGGISGITGEFGKPLILDQLSTATKGMEKMATQARTFACGELPPVTSQITGEQRIPEAVKKVAEMLQPGAAVDMLKTALPEVGFTGQTEARSGASPAHTEDVQKQPSDSRPGATQDNRNGSTQDSAPGATRDTRAGSTQDTQHQPAERGNANAADGPHAVGDPPRRGQANDGTVQMEPVTVRGSADRAYLGETINMNVEPTQHTVQSGESLNRIARDHLGPTATDEEVRAHEREIMRINHITNPRSVHAGQELQLPGHTNDGGFVTQDHAGSKLTRWADGTERVENEDHTGFVRRPAADGGYTEHHWGRNPNENFDVTHTGDGHLRFQRPGDAAATEYYDNQQVRDERTRLEQNAEQRISNPQELAQFRAHMAEFEERAHRQNLPPEEVAKTYQEMSRLLESRGEQPVSQRDRVVLAEQIMDQCAHPTHIDQGQHSTCNVNTVEARLYTRNPSEAARMVTDVATTGHFTTRDGGTTVNVPVGSLRRDSEAQGNPPGNGDRSYASQVFQVTAVNYHHQTTPYTYTDSAGRVHNVPAGGMRYEQNRNPVPPDTGERLYDTTTRPPTLVGRSPDLTDDGIVRLNNRLTGETGNDVMIDHRDWVYGNAAGVTTVANETEFNDRLAAAQRDGKMPIIIHVHSGNEPFLRDSGGGAAGGSGGDHVVTVTGYEAGPPPRVHVDNQWGENVDYQNDRSMSVHDLYMTMRGPDHSGTIADMQRDVDENRRTGHIDTQKEFELLRLRHNLPTTDANYLNNADYDRLAREQMEAANRRWTQQRADGTFNQADYDNARTKIAEIERNLPPDRRLNWVDQMHRNGVINDAEYDRELTRCIQGSRERWAEEDSHRPSTGNATERQNARTNLRRLLDELPADRRQAILDNSR